MEVKNKQVPWNKGLSGLTKDHRFDDSVVFCENSKHPRHRVKQRILRDDLIKYECQCCGIGPFWNGSPMPLILDHVNGVNNDNRIENLRFVCSNCDSQLVTYKSRNRRTLH